MGVFNNKLFSFFIILFVLIVGGFCYVINLINTSFVGMTCTEENLARIKAKTMLVLGASVKENGQMSDVFKDRVVIAIDAYKKGLASNILVSGDHGTKYYDEVGAAKSFLLENGVRLEDIFLDHAGFDTYDSFFRAKEIFGVKSLIISTQDFHLPRALYIAKSLGIDACGMSADLHRYKTEDWMFVREQFAKLKAFFDVNFKSSPKFLGPKVEME